MTNTEKLAEIAVVWTRLNNAINTMLVANPECISDAAREVKALRKYYDEVFSNYVVTTISNEAMQVAIQKSTGLAT